MSINWSKCKREIEIGLDSTTEQINSTNPKITTEEFGEWKRNILIEVDNKIICLKHQAKVHKRNPVLKQDTVIEYLHKHELHELQENYVLVPIDKAVNKIAIVTATGLEPRTTSFVKEHSTIWPNWPND